MNRQETEKSLKRYLKRSKRFSYSLATLICFMITGSISLSADINTEMNIQKLLNEIREEKNILDEKILEAEKGIVLLENSKDKSRQFFFSFLLEGRKAHDYEDNGFSDFINNGSGGNDGGDDKEEDIDIPDLIETVEPNVPIINNPLPNESQIVNEPDFSFKPVGDVAIGKIPNDINVNIGSGTAEIPVSEINTEDFNIIDEGSISNPGDVGQIGNLDDVVIPEMPRENIVTEIQKPTVNTVGDLSTFTPPEIEIAVNDITTPQNIFINTVKIESNGFNQGSGTKKFKNYDVVFQGNDPIVIQNYKNYNAGTGENAFGITFDQNDLRYSNSMEIVNNDSTIINSENLREYYYNPKTPGWIGTELDTPVATFISDVRDVDVSITGDYNIEYKRSKDEDTGTNYIRMFLSSNPAGIVNSGYGGSNQQTIKITDFSGTLNLTTVPDENGNINGNLIGLEHQTWDKLETSGREDAFRKSYSVLLNSGTINIGEELYGENENLIADEKTRNVIGIMIDLEQSSGLAYKNINNKTINANTINLYGTNSIGMSFEEYKNADNLKDGRFNLRDDAYIGNINVNGTQNYGFRMANIFSEITEADQNEINKNEDDSGGGPEGQRKRLEEDFATYFDKVKIIGKTSDGKIQIHNEETGSLENLKDKNGQDINYTSKITVAGNNNAGMVVGKSLSDSAEDYIGTYGDGKVNAIANFENISIEVNGNQTIGFVRDKNYSDNNKNDMVIDDKNITDINFGENAQNSVLLRAEQYGIALDRDLEVKNSNPTSTEKDGEQTYNVVMQATRQSWDKDGNGEADTNSAGKVTNNKKISGNVDNVIGLMASGTVTVADGESNANWQNGDKNNDGFAVAENKGSIILTGNNNIGMAVMDGNKGTLSNKGKISIVGDNGTGIYNNNGTVDINGEIKIAGSNGIAVSNIGGTVNIGSGEKILLTVSNKIGMGATGVYSQGGTVNFGKPDGGTTFINGGLGSSYEFSGASGVYTKGNSSINGNVEILNTKAGIVAESGTATIKGNVTYNGSGFALYAKSDDVSTNVDEKGKITLDSSSTLTLEGKSYGTNIDTDRKDDNKAIDFNNSTIHVFSNDVTIFNIQENKKSEDRFTISANKTNILNEDTIQITESDDLYQYVGEVKIDGTGYKGYKIASIDGGIINLDGENNKNKNFLEKYKFQKSTVNMTTDTDVTLSNTEADTYFGGDVVGIGMSSSKNIGKDYTAGEKSVGEQQRAETQINISGGTLTADRTENKKDKSTIGAYIDFGEIALGSGEGQAGHIVVENENSDGNVVNNNGIGIYTKNGSKVSVSKKSSITVNGDNGIGIYAEATVAKGTDKNKFGGDITVLDVNNAGDINIKGKSGVGIYADNSGHDSVKANVSNSGTITVGAGTEQNISAGIYGINTNITNSGTINVGTADEVSTNSKVTGVGIYAENSDVKAGGEINLGGNTVGIYLKEDSNITTNEGNISFGVLNEENTDRKIGILALGNGENSGLDINFNIDMSRAVNGTAVVAEKRDVTIAEEKEISVSGNQGRGIRVTEGEAVNNGTINVGDEKLLSASSEQSSAVGILAVNKNGVVDNKGTVNVNSQKGIGIYIENDGENITGNTLNSIGTVNLNGNNSTGIALKGTDISIGDKNLSAENIIFKNGVQNAVGIYGDNSKITVSENISKEIDGTNDILIAGVNGSTVVNNGEITISNSGDSISDSVHNIGIYLGENSSYINGETGKITAKDGAVGIYSDSSKDLKDINVAVESDGTQTIGVVLNEKSEKENKNISGTVDFKTESKGIALKEDKKIGVYTNNSNVNIGENEKLTLNYDAESSGTGLYLNNSSLSGKGTIEITGENSQNIEDVPNSVGIYYNSDKDSEAGITSSNEIKLNINKSNTVGVYVGEGSTLTKQKGGEINIGSEKIKVSNVTGMTAGQSAVINNSGTINLINSDKGIGIASLGGTVSNSGTITIGENSIHGTGIFLSNNSTFDGQNGTIVIENSGNDDGIGIGIYSNGQNKIENTGTFKMAEGNIAVYSDGSNISADINLSSNEEKFNNKGTTAVVAKSNGTDSITIGGSTEKKMEITIAESTENNTSTGIIAFDDRVKINNVSVDSTANSDKSSNKLAYGIYLKGGNSENPENYEIDKADISIVKGIGIVLNGELQTVKNNFENANDKVSISGSTININSYSEPESNSETGIGIYLGKNKDLALNDGNTLNVSYGTGIYGEAGSKITIGETVKAEGNGNTVNLQGYSVGVYTNGENSTITIEENTKVSFDKTIESIEGKDTGVVSGAFAYTQKGSITNHASINSEDAELENFTALLAKNGNITNSGDITLSGNGVFGIASVENGETVVNSGDIIVQNDSIENVSNESEETSKPVGAVGIYSENAGIENTGIITAGNSSAGIVYNGSNEKAEINAGTITLNGENGIGIILSGKDDSTGKAGNVVIGSVSSEKNKNLGVYVKDFTAGSMTIGNITLGDESLGLYFDNSEITNKKIETGDITVGAEGIGIASVNSNVLVDREGHSISMGEKGTAVYVNGGTLQMASMENISVGKGGTFIHADGGDLILENTMSEIKIDGSNGMILENGGNVKLAENSSSQKITNMNVINGGTGIIVRGENTKRPDILSDDAVITLGSGNADSYSVGIYYQNAEDINKLPKIKIGYDENGANHTIGTIYDRTYGELTVSSEDIVMDNNISDSIGVIVRRNNITDTEKDKSVTLKAESSDAPIIKVDGNNNIGLAGKNSIINVNGDIEVGLVETSRNSIGVYLTGTTNDITHSYTGSGDISVGSDSYGIYAKNYDVVQNGNITADGDNSIGIAGVIDEKDGGNHGHSHSITINDGIISAENGAIGVYGRDTDIIVENGKISTSGIHSTGLASAENGNITFKGTADIQGEGSIGIYKDTLLGKEEKPSAENGADKNVVTVSKGDWTVGDKAVGIYANSREKNEAGEIIKTGESITVDNSADMTLGKGAIGIYSTGANVVANSGAIKISGGYTENNKQFSSVGIYMANGVAGTRAIGTNSGEIVVDGNGAVGIQASGYVDFTNNGNIFVTDSGSGIGLSANYGAVMTNNAEIAVSGENSIGMYAKAVENYGSKVVNGEDAKITVNGTGIGMSADGIGAVAENNGTIILNGKENIDVNTDEEIKYNISLIGMGAFNGGTIINNGEITVNDGIGMYVEDGSKFEIGEKGHLTINNGVGIMGNGATVNEGHITINGGVGVVDTSEAKDGDIEIGTGSVIIDNVNKVITINENFTTAGGILEAEDFNIKLDNPTVDITEGGAGFVAPNISGEVKLDSNFALTGNGISYKVEDFIDKDSDVKVNTSILFKPEISEEGDLTVTKNPYKDISIGNTFDERDNALDDILAGGISGMDTLKNLNYYLNNIGDVNILKAEYDRVADALSGNIYGNVQSRMQDISRTFDNSFDEMVSRKNPSKENDKFSLIYTDGEYENSVKGVVGYDYNIAGFNYMKEYEEKELNKKYGYEFGFAGSKFKFKDSGSEEKIYSLRGGVHQVKYFENGLSLLSRAEIGYNRHDTDREISFGGYSFENGADFNSYMAGIDNKLRKSYFKNDNIDLGIYAGLNLEYGIFDDIKDDGNTGIDLKVKSNDYLSAETFVGFDAEAVKYLRNDWAVRISADVNYSYDFGDNYGANEVKVGNDYISLMSEVKTRDVASGKISFALDKSDYFTVALEGNVSKDFKRDEDYWNVGLRFTYVFGSDKLPMEFLNMKNYFDFDKSELKPEGKEAVKEMSEFLNKKNIKGTVLIEGHSDSTGRENYNQKLSEKRAEAVKAEFQKNVADKNIDFITKGYGERKPSATNETKEGRAQNRRAEINLINRQ